MFAVVAVFSPAALAQSFPESAWEPALAMDLWHVRTKPLPVLRKIVPVLVLVLS
jgi:hypothetical protein